MYTSFWFQKNLKQQSACLPVRNMRKITVEITIYSRPSHDLIVFLFFFHFTFSSLPGGFCQKSMSFSLLCGCDANISPELSAPSFSSPDRSAVTLPPFIKQKQNLNVRHRTKD